ncbi:Transposase [Streptomyces sp. ADI98-10]|nr:Transposase [Streptomyces sp. ADI98-10]
MAQPSRYPLELRRRAVRMFAEVRGDHPTETAALQSVAEKLDIGSRETLRNWVKQHEIDAGQRPGTTTQESARLKALKKENAELKRANDILKAAAAFFAAELDRNPERFRAGGSDPRCRSRPNGSSGPGLRLEHGRDEILRQLDCRLDWHGLAVRREEVEFSGRPVVGPETRSHRKGVAHVLLALDE